MTVKEHSTLTGASLHEPKGAAAASVSTVYVANGSGSGSWTTVPLAGLASTAKAFQSQLLHVRDEKTNGTNGGTFVAGSWQTRTLNTVVTNEISSASLGSNQITLPAGTYWFEASVPGFSIARNQARLYNVTDASVTFIGQNGYAFGGNRTEVKCRVTIAGTKVFRIEHYNNGDGSAGTSAFGSANSIGSTEVYTEVFIWKVA